MTEHILKTWPFPFQAILDGTKTHEIRKDDRCFEEGDILHLREFDPNPIGMFSFYTGRELRVRVTYKSEGGAWGLPKELCVMSVRLVAATGLGGRGE